MQSNFSLWGFPHVQYVHGAVVFVIRSLSSTATSVHISSSVAISNIETNHQLPCHCEEGQRPDVAISRYDVCFCTAHQALYREITTALRASQ